MWVLHGLEEDCCDFAEGFVVVGELGHVGGFFQGGEGLEVGLGGDGAGEGFVDGLDGGDGVLVVVGVGDGVEELKSEENASG
ncbi:MAG: hypothetical protein ACWA5W_02915 [Phycisphaerales bacterium]